MTEILNPGWTGVAQRHVVKGLLVPSRGLVPFGGKDVLLVPPQSVQVCLPEFRARHWRLEVSRKPNFLTSDAPLVVWRPHTASDAFSEFGLKLSRVGNCNQDIADSCQHVVVGHPDRHAALDKVELRKQSPALRFNVGPSIRENPDGNHEPMGDILHTWTTRRRQQ